MSSGSVRVMVLLSSAAANNSTTAAKCRRQCESAKRNHATRAKKKSRPDKTSLGYPFNRRNPQSSTGGSLGDAPSLAGARARAVALAVLSGGAW